MMETLLSFRSVIDQQGTLLYTAILFQAARTVGELLQEGEVEPRSAPSQTFNIVEDLSGAQKRGRPALLQVSQPTLDFPAAPFPAVDVMLDGAAIYKGRDSGNYQAR